MSPSSLNRVARSVDVALVAVANWYPDPTAAGQLRYWDGSAWTAHTALAAPPAYAVAPPGTPVPGPTRNSPYAVAAPQRRQWTRMAAIAVGLVLGLAAIRLVLGSLHVTTFVTNDNSIDEFGYSQTVRGDIASINRAAAGLHPACDKGGQLQACYDADRVMIATLTDVHDALARATVPTRYAGPHRQLLAALALDAQSFAQRNRAIETHSNAGWETSNDAIGRAVAAVDAALHAYPAGTVLAGP